MGVRRVHGTRNPVRSVPRDLLHRPYRPFGAGGGRVAQVPGVGSVGGRRGSRVLPAVPPPVTRRAVEDTRGREPDHV